MLSSTSLRASLLASLVAATVASPLELESRQQGCGNNCARAVIAGSFPDRPTKADCSSFLAVTTTPPVFTHTVTVSTFETDVITDVQVTTETTRTTEIDVSTAVVTETVTVPAEIRTPVKREDKPLPTYATACKDSAAYSKACSCIGVSAFTTEAPTPSTTVTVTATGYVTETTLTTQTDLTTATDVISTVTTDYATVTTTLAPAGPTAIVKNGGFEDGLSPWTFDATPGMSHALETTDSRVYSGDQSLRISRQGGVQWGLSITAWQPVSVVAGRSYILKYTVMNSALLANCWTYAFFTFAQGPFVDGVHPQTPLFFAANGQESWRTNQVQLTVREGYSSGSVAVRLYCDASDSISFWIDNVSMEEVVVN